MMVFMRVWFVGGSDSGIVLGFDSLRIFNNWEKKQTNVLGFEFIEFADIDPD